MTDRDHLAHTVIDAARQLGPTGLSVGTSGNVSARFGDTFLITPSGMAYDALRPGDIVSVTMNGEAKGPHPPSSEWRMHRDIYVAKPEAGGIVHAHSTFATTLACLRQGIPAFHYMVAVAGGADIRCADYTTFGTQALSDAVLEALSGRKACLMANHGQISTDRDVASAFSLAIEVEELAKQYWHAQEGGQPVLLNDDEMDEVLEKFKDYRAK